MPQSQDIHMNVSKTHRGQTVRTAGQGKHWDACMHLWQDMRAPAHASLAQEMHAPKSLPGACIACVPHLKVYRHPNCTLINHCSIQISQSARMKMPYTQTIDPDACNSLGARISQTKRRTRRLHTRLGTCISCLPQM